MNLLQGMEYKYQTPLGGALSYDQHSVMVISGGDG